jgi:STE24 endopeptidase
MILFFLSTLPSLPLSIYQTFVLEEKHGFNQTTPSLFVADLVKGWAIAFAFGGPFVAMFMYIVKWAGNRFVPWLMSFLSVSYSLDPRFAAHQ